MTTPTKSIFRLILEESKSRRSLLFLGIVALLAALTPLWPLADPALVHLDEKLAAPTLSSWWRVAAGQRPEESGLDRIMDGARRSLFGNGHLGPLLGTDELGRCLLSRIFHGARVSLQVAAAASLMSLILGVLYGALSGYAAGKIDLVLMRIVDVVTSLPVVFLVIFIVAILRGIRNAHPDLEIGQVFILFTVIGSVSWLTTARVVRAESLAQRRSNYVLAAEASGRTRTQILFVHLIPNTLPVVLVTLSLNVPRIMLFEAFLSFLGLGVEAPSVSFGLLARQGYDALSPVHLSWWIVLFPGLLFAATLLAMNLLGDGLRDALDPRLAQSAPKERP